MLPFCLTLLSQVQQLSNIIIPMKTSFQRIALLLLASAVWTLVGTSCRTVRGFGQDVEHVGGHIESAAR